MSETKVEVKNNLIGRSLKASLYGGIVAGIIFGILMQMMGKLGMIAGMMGSSSIAVGWMIHMIISIIFGLGFGIIAVNAKQVIGLSLVYGVILWIIGPLLIMPMMMGMGINLAQAFTSAQLMNLMTHLLFAVILGFVYKKTV